MALKFYTWREIYFISKNGMAEEYLSIEETKDITVNGKRYEATILGFNHDDLADGSGKAGITFGLTECLDKEYPMNETKTNIGGWKDSKMRRFLSEDIFNSLEKDLKAVISPVIKVTNIGGGSSEIEKTTDKLFLFSVDEIYGVSQREEDQKGVGNGCDVWGWEGSLSKPEGKQYPYFQKKNHVIKNRMEKSSWYWLRSPDSDNSSYFHTVVDADGSKEDCGCAHDYANSNSGVVFGFAI